MIRYILNGSFEPLWRANARDDAEKLKHDLTINRRKFITGGTLTAAGLVAIDEYIGMRRAVAGVLQRGGAVGSGPPPTVTHITIERTGAHYDFLSDAVVAMSSGDNILLPAGNTYLNTSGVTTYYASWQNTNSIGKGFTAGDGFNSMFLGIHTDVYNGMLPSADYGSFTGTGSANNGRAAITPPYGITSVAITPGDTVVHFDSTIPVSVWNTSGTNPAYIDSGVNLGQFANDQINYTGVDIPSNSLTGCDTSGLSGVVPIGTVIGGFVQNGQGIFACYGANPGWGLTNIEAAYAFWAGANAVMSPIRQADSFAGQTPVGSMTVSNCYLHDCRDHAGIGYTGIGPTSTFAHLFDTEIFQLGAFDQTNANTHNLYIGHMGELICDNVYSHKTNGTWLIKSRANLNFIRYCQIIGERTDSNPANIENSGCDFSNGGLTYFIGNLCQQSLKSANQQINYNAEYLGPLEGGATNATQEIYVVNCTLVGPSNGAGNNGDASRAPIKLNGCFVQNPEITLLSQSSGGSLPARQYWAQMTLIGTSGGETTSSTNIGDIGGGSAIETLAVSSSSLLNIASPMARTGAADVNYYLNYADPQIFLSPSAIVGALPQTGNYYFWDSANTQPIFSTTSGGVTISATGTATNGSNVITGLTSLVGVGSIAQLRRLSVYSSGTATTLSVSDVDVSANTLTLNDNWAGSTGSASLTFGYYLYIGITYATSLGDSINGSMLRTDDGRGPKFGTFYFNYNPDDSHGSDPWTDGSYAQHNTYLILSAAIQVPPGQKLIVNAPPSGPSYATGINVWATLVQYTVFIQFSPDNTLDGAVHGMSKLSTSPTAFGSAWTSPAGVITKGQQQISPGILIMPNAFLQNASPVALGTAFIEPTSGLVNHNPTQGQLLWQRLGAIQGNNGGQLSVWIAKVPGTLTGYVETAYMFGSQTVNGQVTVWRGIDTSNPYDTNFLSPVNVQQQPVSVNTASTNDTVLGIWNTTGSGAGSGFTLASLVGRCMTEYAQFLTAQTGLSVSVASGGAQDFGIVLALHGSSSSPTLVGSAITVNTTSATPTFTVPSASTGDYIVFAAANSVYGLGQIGVPCTSSAVGVSPLYKVQNCIAANFNPATLGSDLLVIDGDTTAPMPGGHGTEVTNLYCNPFNGSSFGSPTWATVFSDATQSDFVYTLAGGSPALNAASDPGSSPESQNLAPAYQSGFSGLPTPGTPVAPKVARTDIGPSKTGSIGDSLNF